jgi:hypothetical protein
LNTKRAIFLTAVIISTISCAHDKTIEFARYLQAEKRLRDKIRDKVAYEDSVAHIRQHYGIDTEQEFSRLTRKPSEWIVLLKALKHE